ncbi:MAG TPA: energy transducer TonB [Pseudoxanthomonas sp.]|nr:energy transducer TonB [Pseudoxanthomonas sp.]
MSGPIATIASTFRASAFASSILLLAGCGDDAPRVAAIPPTPLFAIDTSKPDYPIELACANIGGTPVFNVVVGREGKPVEVKLLAGSGQPALDAAAEKAVRDWVFEAATRNGQPVVQGIQVPVRFTPPAERPTECFQYDSQK